MSTKTISVNPEFFNLKNTKTKKNKKKRNIIKLSITYKKMQLKKS